MRRIYVGLLMLAAACIAITPAVEAGDAFIKFGAVVSPKDDRGLADRWLMSGGSDYSFMEQVYWGWEIQFAKHTDKIVGLDLETDEVKDAPFNILLNFKFKTPGQPLRFVAGAGAGLLSTFVWNGDSQWVKDFGFHGVGGVEFGREKNKLGFAAEVQVQRAFDSNADTALIILGGINF